MSAPADTRAALIPCLRYRDAHAAIDWLCRAFGFARHAAAAEVVIPLAGQGYGGRGYACRDLEGHPWWFGDYDPWRAP